jgi:intracellular sulfur oxidation DsrE/DsrF family protein
MAELPTDTSLARQPHSGRRSALRAGVAAVATAATMATGRVFRLYMIKQAGGCQIEIIHRCIPYQPIAHPRPFVPDWTIEVREAEVAIEVVAVGPGIYLVRDGNPNAERITGVVKQGVKFDDCMNTIETIERNTGKPFPLNPQAQRVPSGVSQFLTLSEHGYTIVRP